MAQRKSTAQLYGTKQVADVLGIPEWRVKNFTEGGAYGLPQPLTVGSGRGSRRVYNENDVLRLALANKLVECGFSPEAVGAGVGEIPQSRLTNWGVEDGDTEYSQLVLTSRQGKWRVEQLYEVMDQIEHDNFVGLFILDFPFVLREVIEKMNPQTEPVASKTTEGGKS